MRIEIFLTEIIKGLAWTDVMFSAFIVLVALWIICKPEIKRRCEQCRAGCLGKTRAGQSLTLLRRFGAPQVAGNHPRPTVLGLRRKI